MPQFFYKYMTARVAKGPDARRVMASELRRGMGASTPGQAEALKVLKDTWRAMVPTFRVLCLSEVHDAASMWNHYADGYKGVVLRFLAVKEVGVPGSPAGRVSGHPAVNR